MLDQENNYAVRRTTIAFALLAGIALVTFAAAPAPAHAQDTAPYEQAQKKEKKGLFGNRFARLASAADAAAMTDRKGSATAAAADARDVMVY